MVVTYVVKNCKISEFSWDVIFTVCAQTIEDFSNGWRDFYSRYFALFLYPLSESWRNVVRLFINLAACSHEIFSVKCIIFSCEYLPRASTTVYHLTTWLPTPYSNHLLHLWCSKSFPHRFMFCFSATKPVLCELWAESWLQDSRSQGSIPRHTPRTIVFIIQHDFQDICYFFRSLINVHKLVKMLLTVLNILSLFWNQ